MKLFLSLLLATLIGTFVFIGFYLMLSQASDFFYLQSELVWLLPIFGLVLGMAMIRLPTQTNEQLENIWTAPWVFVSTILSHFFGASTGREMAVTHIVGSIYSQIAQKLKMQSHDSELIQKIGVGVGFSLALQNPVVGIIYIFERHHSRFHLTTALWTALFSSLAFFISRNFIAGPQFPALQIPSGLNFELLFNLSILLIATVVFAVSYDWALSKTQVHLHKYKATLRLFIVGLIIAVLTMFWGPQFNSLGLHLITSAFQGTTDFKLFAGKLFFTFLCIAAGFRGGEFIPSWVIGCLWGSFLASFLFGIPASLAAMVASLALVSVRLHIPLTCFVILFMWSQSPWALLGGVIYFVSHKIKNSKVLTSFSITQN